MADYSPGSLLAIRAARAELYAAQAERRRVYLLTGGKGGVRPKDAQDVAVARGNLIEARMTARMEVVPAEGE